MTSLNLTGLEGQLKWHCIPDCIETMEMFKHLSQLVSVWAQKFGKYFNTTVSTAEPPPPPTTKTQLCSAQT
jgi:hypothetical protein